MATRPPRVQIGNLETGQALNAQYNPQQVDDVLECNFQRVVVPGLSHTILQYVNTNNAQLKMDFGFDALSDEELDLAKQQAFIDHLMYQRKAASNVATGAPPRVLFFWPGLYSLVVQITKRKIRHQRFEDNMHSTWFVAEIEFEENRTTRLFSEDVLQDGMIRSGQ